MSDLASAELMSKWAAPIQHRGTSGEAVVLIHGFTGHPGHWIPLADLLASRGHTVVAPRLAGHGTSPHDLATTSADDWVGSARAAVDSVSDHRRVHLAGLSMGGMVAILLARPTAAATITTINTPVLVADRRAVLAPFVHRFIPTVAAANEPVPDPELGHLWSPYDTLPIVAVADLVRLIGRGWLAAGRLRRPALVIQSRADRVVRPISGPLLARRLSGRLIWLESARHTATLDPERPAVHAAIVDLVEC